MRVTRAQLGGCLQRQACLSCASRAAERQQVDIVPRQEPEYLGELLLPAQEWR
jgi:hypothetical protein